MAIKICSAPFDPWQEMTLFQDECSHLAGKYGATNVFVGTMRDFNEGDDVSSMVLEHYPGMTENQLGLITEQAAQQWPLLDTLLVHRVGVIVPNDPIVLVAVWTSHRGDAFDAGRFIMEALKTQAPFWKKEVLKTGQQRWVEKNTDGYLRDESS
jgi:molybdopterin synthase catalytic subunit